MSKTLLDFEYEFDFKLIGLSCHQKDYRLAWFLNSALSWDLRKMDNLQVNLSKGVKHSFVRNGFFHEEMNLQIDLISNLGEGVYLVPEYRKADYFIRLDGEIDNTELQNLLKKIKEIEVINMAFELDIESLKSKNNLYFE